MAAFASAAGFLAQAPAPVAAPVPVALAARSPASPQGLWSRWRAEPAPPLRTCGQVAQIACLGGLAVGLASRAPRFRRRRRAEGLHVTSIEQSVRPARGDFDNVENSVARFVPKIAALQKQALELRDGELRHVLQTLQDLRKPELRGVFGQVDQLLTALAGAIDGLKESAQTIRNTELRRNFEQVEAQDAGASAGYSEDSSDELETMMEVHVVGLSHHKAPVEVREKLAVPEHKWNQYAQELVAFARNFSGYLVPEASVLSTCNRFELYFASPEMKKYPAVECVHAFLRQKSGLSRQELEPYLFSHSGEEATNHLFEVSSGLDSLVLGEAQILAQVKACHEHAIQKLDENSPDAVPGAGGKIITKMLNSAIRVGKEVRTKTKIGKGSVSVSSAAVELMIARSRADLKKSARNVKVCILGAGKMSRLLLIALFSKHPDVQLTLVNRSVEKAEALLAEVSARGGSNAKAVGGEQMWQAIEESDVVFAATSSSEPVIRRADLEGRKKGLMLVDIAVPRNIAADCNELDCVHSYSVDDLKKVVQANAEKRQSEVLKAKKLISEDVAKFKLWQASQGSVPYLAALQAMAERIRHEETEKVSPKLKGLHEKEREAVNKLTRHVLDSLLRPIYYSMKEDEHVSSKKNKIHALKSMYRLDPLYKRGLLTQEKQLAQLSA